MKLTEMNLETAQRLMNWWIKTGVCRIDELKNPDVIYNLMFEDGGTSKFYSVPGVLLILLNIDEGKSAFLYELGILEGNYAPKDVKSELISMAKEFKLKRISFLTPSCVNEFSPALKDIGFKYEGRMKYAATYNGKISDLDLYGFYTIKSKSRRRRGRRDARKESTFKVYDWSGDSPVEQNSSNGETQRSPDLEGEVRT